MSKSTTKPANPPAITKNIPVASMTDGLMAPRGGAKSPTKHIAMPAIIRVRQATRLVFFISFFT